MRTPRKRRQQLDELAADADRRAERAEQARTAVERSRHRSLMVASTSEHLADANRIAAMIRDGLLAGGRRDNGNHLHEGGAR